MTVTTEETLILVKPDGVVRGLTGEILRRIEARGYRLVNIRLVQANRSLLAQHYAEHEGKPLYQPLIEFMESGPGVVVGLRVRPIPRRQPPAQSAAISHATGVSRCSRTSYTVQTHPSRPRANSHSGSGNPPTCESVT